MSIQQRVNSIIARHGEPVTIRRVTNTTTNEDAETVAEPNFLLMARVMGAVVVRLEEQLEYENQQSFYSIGQYKAVLSLPFLL